MPIDPSRTFRPVRVALLTISDSRTLETDGSGSWLAEQIKGVGHLLVRRELVTDDLEGLITKLREWIEDDDLEIVITTGGTGITGRDVTPEAFEAVIDKHIPGFGELFRQLSYRSVGTSTIQSRATAGVARGTILFALPGSRGAVKDAWNGILLTQLDSRHRPCNFVELLPRLREHEAP